MKAALSSAASAIHWLSDWASRITLGALFVIGSGMALLISVQVICRYVLNHSLFWSEEIGRICLVWISFLGASAAYKRHGHMGVDFFVCRLSGRTRRASEIVVLLLSFVFFAVLVYYGYSFARFAAAQKTPALGLPVSIGYAVIPVSGGLFLLHGLSHLLKYFQPGPE